MLYVRTPTFPYMTVAFHGVINFTMKVAYSIISSKSIYIYTSEQCTVYSKHTIYHDTRRENNQQLIWLFVILSLLYIKTSMQLPVCIYHRHNIYTTSI